MKVLFFGRLCHLRIMGRPVCRHTLWISAKNRCQHCTPICNTCMTIDDLLVLNVKKFSEIDWIPWYWEACRQTFQLYPQFRFLNVGKWAT